MSDVMVEGLTQVILSLKPRQRRLLITKLVNSRVLDEDAEDRLLLELRKDEPSAPYHEVRKDLCKKGRIK